MKVLVGCEESQAVCIEFRKLGHEAYSCDIQECSGDHPEWHLQMDVLDVINGGVFILQNGETIIIEKFDIGIFHPPCTFMSAAGAVRMFPVAGIIDRDRFYAGQKAKDFFIKLLDCKIIKICVENPKPLRVIGLPPCSQVIQPWQFGHAFSKRTHLWLKNLPSLLPTDIVIEKIERYVSGGSKRHNGTQRKTKSLTHRDAKTNSKTFQGIAKAMADQWGGQL